MQNERTPAIITHVLGIFTLFLGPLVMYFALRRKASPWLRDHLDEAVNYHILLVVVSILLTVAGVFLNPVAASVSLVLLVAALALILVVNPVFGVVAVVKSSKGQAYHFPLDIKLVR
ncbi:MAG TPA: DUF4870 domain-containing protein [Candidatus Thermoplasmatota archaeon]|nr:DUF4870 domain-containing protein [Candidatus Thermoplasmatota archaeon]